MTMTNGQMYAAALTALPGMTPRRLHMLMAEGSPEEMWERIASDSWVVPGLSHDFAETWNNVNPALPDRMREMCDRLGIWVRTLDDTDFPMMRGERAQNPCVLFGRGDLSHLRLQRVGIVGTRNATAAGKHFTRNLGGDLAQLGVSVVSGLARGIDVAAHVGCLEGNGSAVAVVASGLDVVYPREHSRIWNQLGEQGLILSEFPPGTMPEKYKFPQRNRIIAALSSLVVVVESRAAGGSMSTVREAMNRDVPVTAVPGNPAMKSAEGTNKLINDGCQSVCSTDDVLVALNLGSSCLPRVEPRRPPTPNGQELLELLAGVPRTIDWLALATARHVTDVAIDLGRLEADGWAQVTNGWWEALTVRA